MPMKYEHFDGNMPGEVVDIKLRKNDPAISDRVLVTCPH
jgi:hypothetical protein